MPSPEHQSWRDAEPDCAWAHVSYAYALSKAGRLEEAHREVQEALCLDDNDINGQRETAIRQFEEILVWLESHGFNMQLEGMHPRRRIQELLAQQQEENDSATL